MAAFAGSPAAAAEDAGPRFDLLEFEIDGNTVLDVAAVEQAVLPFLGPGRAMADVESARAALERAYQQAGYLTVFVDIPEQQVEGGIVRLHVAEGRVEKLRVTGSRYFSQGWIRSEAGELAEGRVPDFGVVQQQMAALNRNEQRRVQPVLKPGRVPGTVDVELQVKDELPAGVSLEVNNRHTYATTPWRLNASAHYDNLWQRGHSLSATLIVAPDQPDRSRIWLATYALPVGAESTLTAFAIWSNSLVEPLSAVSVAGKGFDLGLRYTRPLALFDIAGAPVSHNVQLGVDYKHFKTDTVTGEFGVLTPLHYLPFQFGYSAARFGESMRTALNTQFVFALRDLFKRSVDCADAGRADQFACSAKDADGSFGYWRGELQHDFGFGGGATLGLHAGWQLSLEPLVSNERYAIGGVDSVRGYLDAAALGDRAIMLGAEWRTPNLAGSEAFAWQHAVDDITGYLFAEGGEVRVLNALPEQPVHTTLRSAGVGLQWRAGRRANGQFDLAFPFDRTSDTPSRDARLHVRLQVAL
jgi:hemolysin activation/secretion protein